MDYRLAQILRVVIIILGVIIILFLLVAAFNGIRGSIRQINEVADAPQSVDINTYRDNGGTMRLVTDGETQGQENFRKTVVSVSATQRNISVYKGYGTAPATSQTFANNKEAYTAFVAALDGVGFTATRAVPSGIERAEECPFGNKYSYQIIAANGSFAQDTWGTSCSKRDGTFAGDGGSVRQLFQLQIPDYSTIVNSVN